CVRIPRADGRKNGLPGVELAAKPRRTHSERPADSRCCQPGAGSEPKLRFRKVGKLIEKCKLPAFPVERLHGSKLGKSSVSGSGVARKIPATRKVQGQLRPAPIFEQAHVPRKIAGRIPVAASALGLSIGVDKIVVRHS